MQLEEHTAGYRGFLRSGSYPTLSLRLRKSGELAGRVASLVALAALAAGVGYKLTQRVVAPNTAPNTALISQAHGAPAEALPVTRHGIGALSVAHSSAISAPLEPPARTAAASTQPLAAASVHRRANVTSEGARPFGQLAQEHSARRKSSEPVAVKADASPRSEATAAVDQARTELIAERVRALDEAGRVGEATHSVDLASAARAPSNAGSTQSAALPAAPAAKPSVAPPAVAANALPLRAAASIVELEVRGSLSAASVRHGVERVRPAFASCYAQAALQAKRNEFGNVQLRFKIDETGRTRALKVASSPLPGLEACLRSAIGKLVCQAPDTGTVQAALLVGFAP